MVHFMKTAVKGRKYAKHEKIGGGKMRTMNGNGFFMELMRAVSYVKVRGEGLKL
jgi:hypothetical protein